MIFTNWLKRRDRTTKDSKKLRRQRGQTAALQLEKLEDRTLLSSYQGIAAALYFPPLGTGLLPALQTNVSNILDNAQSLPFVGHQLGGAANFISNFQQQLINGLNSLADTATDSDIQNALFGVLGNQGGLNILGDLNGDNVVDASDISVTHPAALGSGGLAIEMHLHSDPVLATIPVTFNTGLPSLPFEVNTGGSITLAVGFDYELAFQYNANTQLTSFDTSALLNRFNSANPAHELAVTVNATIPNFTATATIGFMQGSLAPTAGKGPSAFTGIFTLDNLANPQNADLRVDGQADVYLTLSGGSASDGFPTVGANFELHWTFNSSNPTANPPAVSFNGVTLDLGQFLDGVLEPVLSTIQHATAPLKPVLDVLKAPIPGLSDISHFLGEGDISLLSLATLAADEGGYGQVANLANNLLDLVQTIQGLNLSSGISIPLGGFDLSGDGDLRGLTAAKDISNLANTDLTNLTPRDFSQINLSQIESKLPPSVAAGVTKVLDTLTQPSFQFKFTLPILDNPAQGVFDLLLGHDTPLVSLKAQMHVSADSNNANGLSFAGVGLTFGGSIQADAQLTFNYDTYGLRELINALAAGNPSPATIASDIADGFYVDTTRDPATGIPATYLSVGGSIYAELGGSYGIVQVGLEGGINTGASIKDPTPPITINLVDPDNDGKLRFKEIDTSNLLNNFKLSGQLSASLVLHVQIGVTLPVLGFVGLSHDFGLASAVLLDFNHLAAPQPSQLATIDQNGNVALAVGAAYVNRKVYDATGLYEQKQDETDGNENYTITHVADTSIGETIKISAFGVSQTISGVRSIYGAGDQGNLTVDVQPGVEAAATIYGGVGSAYLTYSGTGSANLTAGAQASTLIGGYGANTLTGGPGDDQLIGGQGSNIIWGYGGNNSVIVRVPTAGTNFVSGGNDSTKSNTLEILGLPSAERLAITPAGGGFFKVNVTDYLNNSQDVTTGFGAISNLIVGGAGARNVFIGDLSQTILQTVSVGVSPPDPQLGGSGFIGNKAVSFLRGNTVTVQGSNNGGSIDLSSEKIGSQTVATVVERLAGGAQSQCTITVNGVSSDDGITLDGRGGNTTFNVTKDPVLHYGVTIANTGAPSNDTVVIRADRLPPGSISATDGTVLFHYARNIGGSLLTWTDQLTLADKPTTLRIYAPNGGETITADRSSGETDLYGGSGDDTLEVSGTGTFYLQGNDGSDHYIIHWSSGTPQGNVLILDSGTHYGSDSLVIDDSSNTALGQATYAISANNVSRVDNNQNVYANATASINFVGMSAVTVDTGADSVLGLPNIINVTFTAGNTTTTVNAGTGSDDVQISGLDAIAGAVTVNGNGATTLAVNDIASPASFQTTYGFANQVLTRQRLESNGPGFNTFPAQFNYTNLANLILNVGLCPAGDVLNVFSTGGAAKVILNTMNTIAAVVVGASFASLDAIGTMVVNGGAATSLVVDDRRNSGAIPTTETVTVTGATLTRSAIDLFGSRYSSSITYSGVRSLELDTGGSGTQIYVESTAVPTTINGGVGTFLIDVSAQAKNLDNLVGALTVKGNGTNPLVVNDQNDPNLYASLNQYSLTGTTLTRTGFNGLSGLLTASITFSGLSSLVLDAGTGYADNQVYVEGTATPTTVNAGDRTVLIDVGNQTANLDYVLADITINGSAATVLNLDDEANADTNVAVPTLLGYSSFGLPIFGTIIEHTNTAPTYVVGDGTVSRTNDLVTTNLATGAVLHTGITNQTITYNHIASLGIRGGTTVNTYYVESPAVPSTVDASAGIAVFHVSSLTNNITVLLNPAQPAALATILNALSVLPVPAQPVTVTLDLQGGTFSGQSVSLPDNVKLVIENGTLLGGSPALTVLGGQVSVLNSTLTNATDAPTVLVSGGSLTLRNDIIQESTGYSQVAVRITGGSADLGTAAAPGGNTLNVNGSGIWIDNVGPNPVSAVGDTFEINGVVPTGALTLHASRMTVTLTFDGTIETVTGLSAPFQYIPGSFSQLTIDGSSGGNVFNVESLGAGTPVTIATGSGISTINVSPVAENLDNIKSALTINGNGTVPVIVNDQATPANQAYTVTANTLTRALVGFPEGGHTITYTGLGSLALYAGSVGTNQSNVMTVQSTAAGTPVYLHEGTGYYSSVNVQANSSPLDVDMNGGHGNVTLGRNGIMAGIQALVNVHDSKGTGDSISLIAEDGSDPTPRVVTVDDGTLTGLSAGPIRWTTAPNRGLRGGVQELGITAGYGGNTFNINNTSAFYDFTGIAAGSGTNQVNIRRTTGTLFVQSTGGQNIVTVGSLAPSLGGTLANINGPVYILDQTQTALTLDDSGDTSTAAKTVTFGFDGATYHTVSGLAPATFYYVPQGYFGGLSGVRQLNVYGGAGNDTFTMASSLTPARIKIDGGGGTNTLVGPNTANTWNITGLNSGSLGAVAFANVQSLVGGSSTDSFLFHTGGSLSGSVNGQGGSNTVDYSAYSGNLVVDLPLGTATGVAGGIRNLENVTGSIGNDLIVGDANPNTLIGGTGRNIIIGGAGADTLTEVAANIGDNLLIGGTTDFDQNRAALDAVFAEWTRTDLNFNDRASDLLNGTNGQGATPLNSVSGNLVLLNNATVHADNAADTLTGGGKGTSGTGTGRNWFFVDAYDIITNFLTGKNGDKKTKVR